MFFLAELERVSPGVGRLPLSEPEAALIFDGMALLQSSMSAGCTTFGDLAQKQRAKRIVQELMLHLTGMTTQIPARVEKENIEEWAARFKSV